MVKPIVTDLILLKQKSQPADKNDTQLFTDITDTLRANSHRCVGLAANMIGVRKTVLAAKIGSTEILMINPVIISKSKETYVAEEGCLSLEGTREAVRCKSVTVEYYDKKFRKKRQTFKGFDAQIIQHEMDHFDGIII